MNSLISPERLWSRDEVLSRPCPVPAEPGVYAWFFRDLPGSVAIDGCVINDGMTLLYVGISPDKPNRPDSKQSLRTRLKYHSNSFGGAAPRFSSGFRDAHGNGVRF